MVYRFLYFSVLGLFSSVALVSAQPGPIAVVAPNNYTSASGNGGLNTLDRSTNNPRTYQMQFTPDALGGLPVGAWITGLDFRVYTNATTDFPSTTISWSDYEVTLAQAANSIFNMSTDFQENLLNPVLVKSGPLSIAPDTFRAGSRPNPFATMILFDTPYLYQGGDLVMHFSHTGSDSTMTALFDAVGPNVSGYGTSFRALSATSFHATSGFANSPLTIVKIVFTPTITQSVTLDADQFIISASGGLSGQTCQVLSTTNIALLTSQWTPISTNQFGASGGFTYTNIIQPDVPARYFRLMLP